MCLYPTGWAQLVKNPPAMWRPRFSPWVGKIPWRREWLPIPGFLPGESHGQRSLVGYSPQGRRVRNDWATEHTTSWSSMPGLLLDLGSSVPEITTSPCFELGLGSRWLSVTSPALRLSPSVWCQGKSLDFGTLQMRLKSKCRSIWNEAEDK